MKSKSLYDTNAILRKLLPSRTRQANLIVPVPGPAVGVRRVIADPAKSAGGPISTVGDGEALSNHSLHSIRADFAPGDAGALTDQQSQPRFAFYAGGPICIVFFAAFDFAGNPHNAA